MSCKQQQNDDATNDNPIDSESLKTIFSQEGNKPFHGQQSYDKSYYTSKQ